MRVSGALEVCRSSWRETTEPATAKAHAYRR
jgi:hypothetical protein